MKPQTWHWLTISSRRTPKNHTINKGISDKPPRNQQTWWLEVFPMYFHHTLYTSRVNSGWFTRMHQPEIRSLWSTIVPPYPSICDAIMNLMTPASEVFAIYPAPINSHQLYPHTISYRIAYSVLGEFMKTTRKEHLKFWVCIYIYYTYAYIYIYMYICIYPLNHHCDSNKKVIPFGKRMTSFQTRQENNTRMY